MSRSYKPVTSVKEVPEHLRKLRRQYLRYQQAEIIYSISHKKLLELASDTPPPIPKVLYHVAVNGQPTGPYDVNYLAQMITNNQLTKDMLVWTNGMADWCRADSVEELKGLFTNAMTPIPTVEK